MGGLAFLDPTFFPITHGRRQRLEALKEPGEPGVVPDAAKKGEGDRDVRERADVVDGTGRGGADTERVGELREPVFVLAAR